MTTMIYKPVPQSHFYTDVHKRRLARRKTKPFAMELYLHLKTIAECRAKAQLPTSACCTTHPFLPVTRKRQKQQGWAGGPICPEDLRQRELCVGSLSHSFLHRSMWLPCHLKELENRTVLACASPLSAAEHRQGGRELGPPLPTLGTPLH